LLGSRCNKIVHYLLLSCLHFFPAMDCSLTLLTLPIVFCAFLKAARLSSSLLLTATHGCLPALSWPMTGRAKICAAALEVLLPLEDFSQNEQRAFLDLPFFAAVLFVMLVQEIVTLTMTELSPLPQPASMTRFLTTLGNCTTTARP
jgi:hypothetical protein